MDSLLHLHLASKPELFVVLPAVSLTTPFTSCEKAIAGLFIVFRFLDGNSLGQNFAQEGRWKNGTLAVFKFDDQPLRRSLGGHDANARTGFHTVILRRISAICLPCSGQKPPGKASHSPMDLYGSSDACPGWNM